MFQIRGIFRSYGQEYREKMEGIILDLFAIFVVATVKGNIREEMRSLGMQTVTNL